MGIVKPITGKELVSKIEIHVDSTIVHSILTASLINKPTANTIQNVQFPANISSYEPRHYFAKIPSYMNMTLECISNDAGYNIGDIVLINTNINKLSNLGLMISLTTERCIMHIKQADGKFLAIRAKDSTDLVPLDTTKWIVRIFLH